MSTHSNSSQPSAGVYYFGGSGGIAEPQPGEMPFLLPEDEALDPYGVAPLHQQRNDFPRGKRRRPARRGYQPSDDFDETGADPGTGLVQRGRVNHSRLMRHLGAGADLL